MVPSQTSFIVGIKVLSALSITGLSANGKIKGEILPGGLPPISFTRCVTSRQLPVCAAQHFCLTSHAGEK